MEFCGVCSYINMRVKLRYTLPVSQMALAVGLLWWTDLWFKATNRLGHIGDISPALTLCISISAPVALVRAIWFRYLSAYGDYLALVLAVGALWYWVALNIESLRRNKKVLMFTWVPLRLASDLLLIAMGVFWVIAWVPEARRSMLSWPWMLAVVGSLLAWSVGLIFFFGRDFIACAPVRARNH
jgi:hypothetical protein